MFSQNEDYSWFPRLANISYGVLGSALEKSQFDFNGTDRKLVQARIGTEVYQYMSVIILFSLIAGLFSGILGMFAAFIVSFTPLSSTLLEAMPISLGSGMFTLLAFILLGGGGSVVGSGLTYIVGWYYARYLAGISQSQINDALPYATTYMFALSRGGMPLLKIIERISSAKQTYGAIANEFSTISTNIHVKNQSVGLAFKTMGRETPSESFREFTESFQNVLESGGDLSRFLERKSQDYLDEAEQEQEDFIQFLALLGEVYVIVFVAAPLFLVVIVVTISLSQGGGFFLLAGIVYLLVPVSNFGFFILLDTFTPDKDYISTTIDTDDVDIEDPDLLNERAEVYNDPWLSQISELVETRERIRFIRNPLRRFFERPVDTLYVTLPVTFLFYIFVIVTGLFKFSFTALVQSPVIQTSLIFTIPLLINIVPYTLFFESNSRKRKKIESQFPDALNTLSDSNEMGMTLVEALESSAKNMSGIMGDEFRDMAKYISLKNDVKGALIRFANRMETFSVTRTVKMLVDSLESSGDVTDVLDVAARDVKQQYLLQKQRRQELSMYTVIVLVSFVIYLIIIIVLDSLFLSVLEGEEFSADPGVDAETATNPTAAQGGDLPEDTEVSVQFEDIPTDRFRMAFYHSTLVQALGNGLLAGQLGNEDYRKGFKFSIIMMLISTVAFIFI